MSHSPELRRFLMAYLGTRENAVKAIRKYAGDDTSLGIRELHPGLDNYNIGYNAGIMALVIIPTL